MVLLLARKVVRRLRAAAVAALAVAQEARELRGERLAGDVLLREIVAPLLELLDVRLPSPRPTRRPGSPAPRRSRTASSSSLVSNDAPSSEASRSHSASAARGLGASDT